MANLRRWSSTATGNASVAGGANTINFSEGQNPSTVNNSAREMMAQMRSVYTPSEWGWVEFSATASVASQTVIKIAGNQTGDYTANRRFRIKSGSSTRYGTIVSSSFTAETTITVTVDSGSLSASHSLIAVAAIDSNHVPGNTYVTSASLVTSLGSYVTSSSLNTALGSYLTSASASAAYLTSASAAAQYITSASVSAMIAAAPSGAVLLGYTSLASPSTAVTFSGSWSVYAVLEINFYIAPAATSANSSLTVAAFTDGGTTAILTTPSQAVTAPGPAYGTIKFIGGSGETHKVIMPDMIINTTRTTSLFTATANTGFVNAVRIGLGGGSNTFSAGFALLYGYRKV